MCDDDNNNLDSDNSSIIEADIKNNKINNNIKSKKSTKNVIKNNLTENSDNSKLNIKTNSKDNTFNKTNISIKDTIKKEENTINIDNLRDKIKENNIAQKTSSTSRTLISSPNNIIDINNGNTNRSNKVQFPVLTLGNREENNGN